MPLLRVPLGIVVGAGETHRRQRGRLRFDAQIGEDVLHQRLRDQAPSERRAVGRGPYGDAAETVICVDVTPRPPIARGTDFAAALEARGYRGP